MIANKFFGRAVVSWALIRDFSNASLDLKDFSISASLRATAIGRVWRDEREPEPDFSDGYLIKNALTRASKAIETKAVFGLERD